MDESRVINLRQVISGDVYLSLESITTGRWWDGSKFVDVAAGAIPPLWPVDDGPFVNLRRYNLPVPAETFPDGLYSFVWTCKRTDSAIPLAIMAEVWSLDYEVAKGPFPAVLDGWYWIADTNNRGQYQHYTKR